MELVKEKWDEKDVSEFIMYLKSFVREDKVAWTKNLLNTDMNVLAIKSPEILTIVNEIKKGNYLSFLDLDINEYYENTAINGKLICKIKDFDVMKKYLDNYSMKVDNWASCDLLKFNVKGNETAFLELAKEYAGSEKTFVRRIGMSILFNFIMYDEYVGKVFEMLNGFEAEKEYYVNMMNAWLVCELFIKRRDMTFEFFGNNRLNQFTVNKAISKCRDSFRVSEEDKELLLNFRK